MAGVYFHIPFCKKACHYCDFHFSTFLGNREAMVAGLKQELAMRQHELTATVETIYFGGGTPSLFAADQIAELIEAVESHFGVAHQPEITLEANPDDLSKSHLSELLAAGISRLSIGIQSFDDALLSWMNRAHSAEEARKCIANAREVGFTNLSIDLIYALPGAGLEGLKRDLDEVESFAPQHISIYQLTIEPGTMLGKMLEAGRLAEIPDEQAAQAYDLLADRLEGAGYEHYEISNFAKPGFRSRHNSNYWKKAAYLGIGPGAHSYDGHSRQANVRNNRRYLQLLSQGQLPGERELLSAKDHLNEYLMTQLRTSEGVDKASLLQNGYSPEMLQKNIARFRESGHLLETEQHIRLTRAGRHLADFITADFFLA